MYLQEELKLTKEYKFPVGISEDVQHYANNKYNKTIEADIDKKPDYYDGLFKFLTRYGARKYLIYVIFIAFLGVASLALMNLVDIIIKYYNM
jgi:hypothetical protein